MCYKMLREKFDELVYRVAEKIKEHYRDRVFSIVLFGSVARRTQRPDSDIDILIVASDLPKGRLKRIEEFMEIEEEIEPYLEALRKMGIFTSLSPVLKTPEEVKAGNPLFWDFVEDARILYDKDRFFERELENIKEKLSSFGAKRYWLGSAWYWIVNPDIDS